MNSAAKDETFSEVSRAVWQHLVDRDWDDPKPRSLAISLSLEANELLEHYQWQDTPVGDKEALGEELADILIYALQFAHVLDLDPAAIIRDKLAKSAKKYPAEQYKGRTKAEKTKTWRQAKIEHRKNKTSL